MWRLLALLLVGLGGDAASTTLGEVAAAAASGGGSSAPGAHAGGLSGGLPAGMGSGLGGGVGTGLSTWHGSVFHHRPIYTQQSLQAVLASIEERLRALDALYTARYAPRLDLGVDPQARRLDGIESRLGRLETLLELRLDKLTETISSRQLKDELSKDQLSRSVDSTMERLHHRLGFMETRLDVALTKLQTSQDTLSSRVERMDYGGGGGGGGGGGCGRHSDVGAGLQDVKSSLDELRRSVRDNHDSLLNSTLRAVATGETAMQHHYESLSSALGHMQEELNRTLTVQNDGGGGSAGGGEAQLRHERHVAGNLLNAVERHATSFGSKVTNMYNELWRRTQVLEGLSKDAMALSNATRRELQEGMRTVAMQLSRYCSLQADKAKPGPNTRDNVEVTLEEIRSSMSSYFQTIISTQHMFQDTCHRIQEYEPMLEKYLAETLERIVGLLTSNKCQSQVEDLHRLLKSHHSTVVRNVGHTTNTVLRAANTTSKEARNLATVINEAHDGLLVSTTDIQKGISGMKNEQQIVHQTLKELTAIMNGLQNTVTDLSNRSTSDNMNLKEIQCQGKGTEAANITSELKQISEHNQKHITKEIHNLTQLIMDMLRNISVHSPSTLKEENNAEPVKKDFGNIITANSEQDYDDTSENGIILEAHEENLNSIYDSQNPQTETSSVLKNITTLHLIPQGKEHHNKIQMSQTSTQTETTTHQYSSAIYEDRSSPEHTINILPISNYESSKNQSSNGSSSQMAQHSSTVSTKHYTSENNQSIPQNETFVTIVHNDKPLTSEGQITYSSKQNISVMGHKENHLNHKPHTQVDSTNTQNLHSSENQHLPDAKNNNHTIKEKNTKEDYFTNSSSDIVSEHSNKSTVEVSAEQRESTDFLQQGNSETHSKEFINRFSVHDQNSDTSASFHETPTINASKHTNHGGDHEDMARKLTNDSGIHNLNNSRNENKVIPKNTRHKHINENDTKHYLYRLINKLEELSNRLMNSESRDVSASDNNEHTGSHENSEEEQDYSMPLSTFSNN